MRICVLSQVVGLREAMLARGIEAGAFSWLTAGDGGGGGGGVPASSPEGRAALAEADVLVGEPALCGPLVDSMPKLAWLQSTFAGCNQLLTASTRRDYVATRLAGVFGPDMAEYAALHILSLERGRKAEHERQQRAEWLPSRENGYRRLSSLTLGILGMGDIGSCIARTLSGAFAMRVVGCRRSAGAREGDAECGVSHVYGLDSLPAFLAEADYVVSVLPSTPASRGLLDGEVLRACAARRAALINVGRGDLLSEATVVRALDDGWLSHYVGDVFAPEPLASASPLWRHPKVTVTPHCSAITTADDAAGALAENLRRYAEGGTAQLQHVFHWEHGY